MPLGNKQEVLVFAYGSNMFTRRMQSRVSAATPVTVGHVVQRKLVFHKKSIDGSAKADAVFTNDPSDRVWGVVYRLRASQKRLLDQYEFLGVGYDEAEIDVLCKHGVVRAWMYLARATAIDASLHPYGWYHDFVVHGASEHRLPPSYVAHLKHFQTVDDPDTHRRAMNRRLISP